VQAFAADFSCLLRGHTPVNVEIDGLVSHGLMPSTRRRRTTPAISGGAQQAGAGCPHRCFASLLAKRRSPHRLQRLDCLCPVDLRRTASRTGHDLSRVV
jgi:hypothetical protein